MEEQLEFEFDNVICFHCKKIYSDCQCPEPLVVIEGKKEEEKSG